MDAPVTPTVTLTQSYSFVIRDIFFDAVRRLDFFAGFTARKCKQLQIQPQDLPYLGLYIVGEEMVADGDANAGNIGFTHTLRLGFSVVLQNNDPEVSEQRLDAAFWAIMNGLWCDPYITNMIDPTPYGQRDPPANPDRVMLEGVPRATRRHVWGNNTMTNELPICELQLEVFVVYRTDFIPGPFVDLETIRMQSVLVDDADAVPPADQVQRVFTLYDLTTEPKGE